MMLMLGGFKKPGVDTDQINITRPSKRKVSFSIHAGGMGWEGWSFGCGLSNNCCFVYTASDIMLNKKERKRLSLSRNFVGDYLGFADNPSLRAIVGRCGYYNSIIVLSCDNGCGFLLTE